MLAASTVVTTLLGAVFLLPLLNRDRPDPQQVETPNDGQPVPLAFREFYQSVSHSQDDADEAEDRGHRKAPIAWDDLLAESDDTDDASNAGDPKDELASMDLRDVVASTADEPSPGEAPLDAPETTHGFARVHPHKTTQSTGQPPDGDAPYYVNPAHTSSGSVYAPITVNLDGASVAQEIASQLEKFEQRIEHVLSAGKQPREAYQTARNGRKDRRQRPQKSAPNEEIADLRKDVKELTESVQQLKAETESRLRQLAIRPAAESESESDSGPDTTQVAEAPRETIRDSSPPTPEPSDDFPTPEPREVDSLENSIREPSLDEPEVPLPPKSTTPALLQPTRPNVPDHVPALPVFEDADLPEELSTPAFDEPLDETLDFGLNAIEDDPMPRGDRQAPVESDNVFPPPADEELGNLDLTTEPLKSTHSKPVTAGNAAPVVFQHVHRFAAGEIIDAPVAAHQKRSTHTAGGTKPCPACGNVPPSGNAHPPVKQVSHSITRRSSGHSGLMVPSGPYRPPRVLDGARGRNRHIHRQIRQNHPESEERPSMLHRVGATLQHWSDPVIE